MIQWLRMTQNALLNQGSPPQTCSQTIHGSTPTDANQPIQRQEPVQINQAPACNTEYLHAHRSTQFRSSDCGGDLHRLPLDIPVFRNLPVFSQLWIGCVSHVKDRAGRVLDCVQDPKLLGVVIETPRQLSQTRAVKRSRFYSKVRHSAAAMG